MTAPDFAQPSDIAAVWRPLTASETVIAPGLISQASRKLRQLNPNIDTLIAGNDQLTGLAKDAVVNAVKRVLMNPTGARQYSTTTGPMTDSTTVDTALSSGLLYFADDDLEGLLPTSALIGSFRVKSGYPQSLDPSARGERLGRFGRRRLGRLSPWSK